MRKRKENFKLIQLLLIVVLAVALISVLFLEVKVALPIASADDAKYIKAEVSNLKDNEYASKSMIQISRGEEDSFYIPESYYVEVGSLLSNEIDNLYHATYMGETNCYIEIENPTLVSSSSTSTIYPNVELTIKDGENVTLESTNIDNSYTILLMGYNADSTKIYVKATSGTIKKFGYIDASKLNAFNVPYEASTQEERTALLSENTFNPNEELPASTSKGIRIAIIVCLCVAAVIICLCMFLNKNKKRHTQNTASSSIDYDQTK